jgi:glycerate 2-kinase
MKILIAPNALKECLSAKKAALAIRRGVLRACPEAETILLPLGDGGDGTAESITEALGGTLLTARVQGPLGDPVSAHWGLVEKGRQSPLAVLDMAEASGLRHVPLRRRNPMKTSTFGTGQLIKKALDRGCRHILLGIGGSATVDAGLGMAQALGAQFYDKAGRLLGRGGGEMVKLDRIDFSEVDPRVKDLSFWVAADVSNPLYGPDGAARVYAPQKGASPSQVRVLDEGLKNFAKAVRRDLGRDVSEIPGAGAAGGLGAGVFAFFGVRPQPADILLFPMLHVDRFIRRSDLVFTAEGRVDGQSAQGKAASALSYMSHRWRKPLCILAGQVGPGVEKLAELGMGKVVTINPASLGRREAFREAARNLAKAAERETLQFMKDKV